MPSNGKQQIEQEVDMDQERLNALEAALNNEMREREFYLENAERTSNPVGKTMFRRIADEELEHYERLKQLHESWQDQGKWPETVPLVVAESNLKNTLREVIRRVKQAETGNDNDLEAVRTAIGFEAEAGKFYQKLSAASTNRKEKDFFALLAKIEFEHLESLKETEAYFLDPAGWYQKMEHGGLDGA
jgi:rubrerythrin